MEEKVQFNLYLEKSFVEDFRQFVAEQYGKISKGLLSFEAKQAMQAWISTHKGTQTPLTQKSPNPYPNVFVVREAVKKYLQQRFGYDSIYKVPKQQVIEAISAVRGTDERTIQKWIRLFEKFHVLKWVTPNVVEFL